MATKRKQQTHAKRAREFAVKERRDRKQAKRAAAAAERSARAGAPANDEAGVSAAERDRETAAAEWVR